MHPILKTNFPVDSAIYDIIEQDLAASAKLRGVIDGILAGKVESTYFNEIKKRRDLGPLMGGFREHVMNTLKPIVPWMTPTIKYSDVAVDSWFNKYYNGTTTMMHRHFDAELAVVWYQSSGYFDYEYDGATHTIEVNTGDILIFPGDLNHTSGKHTKIEPKFCMATNIAFANVFVGKVPDETIVKLLKTRREKLNEILSTLDKK